MSNMSHLPSFLTTDPNDDLAAPVAEPNPGAFAWPTPPYAIYPTSLPQQEPEPCEIEGQNGKVMQASLLAYLPAQNVIQLVVPPARKAMALRPNRFRRITLLNPLRPSFMDRGAVPPELTDFHPSIDYRVDMVDGSVLTGRTVGHVEQPEGLGKVVECMCASHECCAHDHADAAHAPDAVDRGQTAVLSLFGSEDNTSQIVRAAAQQTGISADILAQLLPILASVLFGGLNKSMGDGGMGGLLGKVLEQLIRGGGAKRPMASSRSPTPKFFSAEPKNTGER